MPRSSLALCLVLLFGACASEREQPLPPDSGQLDTGTPDSGVVDTGTDLDTGIHPDSGPLPDVGTRDGGIDDGTLDNTSLKNVAVLWDDQVTLCETFQEGRTIEQRREQKVRLMLQPSFRGSLTRASLEAATFSDGLLRFGPMAADRIEFAQPDSSLTMWTLSGPADRTSLTAEITHELGDGRQLIEHLSVTRAAPDESPVEYDTNLEAFAHHVGFFLIDEALGFLPLAPCSAPWRTTTLEAAAATMNGESIVVLREAEVVFTDAGSFPFHPQRMGLFHSGSNKLGITLNSHWGQIYAAEHHNWNEHSLFDFSRDHNWYFRVFKELENGGNVPWFGRALKELELVNFNSFGGERLVSMTMVDVETGVETKDAYESLTDWFPIHDEYLTRQVGSACTNPQAQWVHVWGDDYMHTFRLAGCPAPNTFGFDTHIVVPVIYHPNPSVAGQSITGADIRTVTVEGQPGIEVDLGPQQLQLYGTIANLDGRITENGTVVDSGWTLGGPPFELEGSPIEGVLRGLSEDRSVSVEIVRTYSGQGVGNSTIYIPKSFAITFDGQRHFADSWDGMTYSNTHHNWDDSMTAETEELSFQFSVSGFGNEGVVSAFRKSDNAVVLPQTNLTVGR